MEAYEFLKNRQLIPSNISLHETAMPNYTWGDLVQLLDDYLKVNQVEAEVMAPFMVIAANHKQFEFYAKKYGWDKDKKNYIYASNVDRMRGRRYRDIITVGEYWLNPILKEHNLEYLKSLFCMGAT